MKRRRFVLAALILLYGLLVPIATVAESSAYGEQIANLITAWNQDATKSELIALFGEPYSETETHVSFWDRDQAIMQRYDFNDGRLISAVVSYGVFSKEYRDWMYSMYDSTKSRISELLGDGFGNMFCYNGPGSDAANVDCAANAWSEGGLGVLLVYCMSNDGLQLVTKISLIQ